MNGIIKALSIILTISFALFADSSIGGYLVKVRLFSSDSKTTGYLHFSDNLFSGRYNSCFTCKDDGFSGKQLLFINRLQVASHGDDPTVSTRDTLFLSDSLGTVMYNGTALFHYLAGKKVPVAWFDAVEAVVTVSDGVDNVWVDLKWNDIFKRNSVVFHDTMFAECDGNRWVHIVGFDSSGRKVNSAHSSTGLHSAPTVISPGLKIVSHRKSERQSGNGSCSFMSM